MPTTGKPQLQSTQKLVTRSSSVQDSPKVKAGITESQTKGEMEKGRQSKLDEHLVSEDETPKGGGIDREMRRFMKDVKANLEEMDNKMTVGFNQINSKMASMFDEIRTDMTRMRTDLTETKTKVTAVSSKVDEIESSIEFQATKVADMSKAHDEEIRKTKEDLNKKIAEIDRKILLSEKQDRKYNLLFYGIREEPDEDISEKLRELFIQDLNLDEEKVGNMYFAHGHRIPSEAGTGPRPIILRFTSIGDRDLVLANAKELAGSRRRILIDLPPVMKRERGRLARVAYQIRKNEQMQTRIRDKGLEVFLEVRRNAGDSWIRRAVPV